MNHKFYSLIYCVPFSVANWREEKKQHNNNKHKATASPPPSAVRVNVPIARMCAQEMSGDDTKNKCVFVCNDFYESMALFPFYLWRALTFFYDPPHTSDIESGWRCALLMYDKMHCANFAFEGALSASHSPNAKHSDNQCVVVISQKRKSVNKNHIPQYLCGEISCLPFCWERKSHLVEKHGISIFHFRSETFTRASVLFALGWPNNNLLECIINNNSG